MATTKKKSTTKKSAPKKAVKAVKKAAKKPKRKLQKVFSVQELDLVDATLRPAVGHTLTDKVIPVLQDAVGTPPRP